MASSRQPWFDSSIKKKDDTEDLLVFGYSCKLFRDDEKALYIDQGKHLIPWMGDETLKIDRYDVRGTVYDLRPLEPLPGGAMEAMWSSLSDAERRVEQLCDEERYRALHHNEAEEALYQEEELKRLHKALDPQNSYGQVAYSYDNEGVGESTDDKTNLESTDDQAEEDDEPFIAPPELDIPVGMVLPEKTKLNAIMEKTALFISTQGPQMEILLKMKQSNNPQFSFLSFDCPLHAYYRHLLMAIKTGRYRPNQPKQEEQKEQQEAENAEHYLHPSLAAAASRVDLAPSIPSIPSISYKPSADCAYSMLVNKIKDKQLKSDSNSGPSSPQPGSIHSSHTSSEVSSRRARRTGRVGSEESHPGSGVGGKTARSGSSSSRSSSSSSSSTGSSPNRCPTDKHHQPKTSILTPPGEMQLIIDKMASYVMKNGRDFESVVRSKGDDRFAFLDEGHKFHPYYEHKMRVYQGLEAPVSSTAQQKHSSAKKKKKSAKSPEKKKRPILLPGYEYSDDSSESEESSQNGDTGLKPKLAPVCFSIKKPKEAEILKEVRSALPLEEESSDEDGESQNNTDSNNSTKMASAADPKGSSKNVGSSPEEEMERLKQMLKEKEQQLKEQERQQRLAEKRSQDIFQIDERVKEKVRIQPSEEKIKIQPPEEKVKKSHPPDEEMKKVQPVEGKRDKVQTPEAKHSKTQLLEEKSKRLQPTDEKRKKVHCIEDTHKKIQPFEERYEKVQPAEEKNKNVQPSEEKPKKALPLEERHKKAQPPDERYKKTQPSEERHKKAQPPEERLKKVQPPEEKHKKAQQHPEEKHKKDQPPEEKRKKEPPSEEKQKEALPLEKLVHIVPADKELMTAIPIPRKVDEINEAKECDVKGVESEHSSGREKVLEVEGNKGVSSQVLKKDDVIKEIEDEVITEAEIIDLTDEKDDAPKVTDCKLRLERKRKAAAFLNLIKKEHPLSKNGRRGSDSEVSSKYSSPSPPPAFQSKSESLHTNFNGASIPRTSLMARLTASTGLQRQPSTLLEKKKSRQDKTWLNTESESSSKNSKDRERSRNSASRHRREKKKQDSSPEIDHSRSRSRSVSHSRSPSHRHRIGEDSDQERHCHKHRKADRRRSDHRRKHEMMEEDESVSGYVRHHKRHKEVRHSHFHGHSKRVRESKVTVSDSNSSD